MQDPAPEMVKTVSKPVVAVGEEFTFTITLRNGGNGDLVNAQLTDPMPPKMRALAVDNPACVLGAKGASVSCDFGTVQPGAARVVTITAVASTDGGYTNAATLTSTGIPPLVTRVPVAVLVSACNNLSLEMQLACTHGTCAASLTRPATMLVQGAVGRM